MQIDSALASPHLGDNFASGRQPASLPRQSAEVRSAPYSAADIPGVGGRYKRVFDVTLALASIGLFLPLFCLLAISIRLLNGEPVLYRHERVGRNGKPFFCLKFRTMATNADERLQEHLAGNEEAAREWAATHKLRNDPRITYLGRILRRTSLDELPQLFNILKGEMTFVGPRPIVKAEIQKYGSDISYYLRARPGLTGAWQVSGRNDVSYDSRVVLDRQYVENWSFSRDLLILIKTAAVVTTSRGCY